MAAARERSSWTRKYLRCAVAADFCCALAAGLLAFLLRFNFNSEEHMAYLAASLSLPVLWLAAVALAGGYDGRFIGVGPDEFRKILIAGVALTAVVAIVAYASKVGLARGYVVIALPSATLLDLAARFGLRKRLHRSRSKGSCMRRVVLAGHAAEIADMAAVLRRQTYHGLLVVAACSADSAPGGKIDGIPVPGGGLGSVAGVVAQYDADTVAVLACPEMSGVRLRDLAWELEKSGTDLHVASALLDVAGPRTTIRPVAGLPLLHLDHPEFTGIRPAMKTTLDKVVAIIALLFSAPAFALVSLLITLTDGGPAMFRQTRVGRNGIAFTVYKFRTMVPEAETQKAQLTTSNEHDGPLFKIRDDPRVTAVGAWLRRWSVDELPQLLNVLRGEMSLIGPRPALPEEAARYRDYVRRRLAVKPGLTGLWQVSGRSELSWDESVRLDLRYVENWSFGLDLQILWKTWTAVTGHKGAYLALGSRLIESPAAMRRG
ncbi:MAG TPA: sugar transferase [Streptosporangiaceae bacterium]|jgi:exopolysaccharide biosynthesis polyprenyl glycosylphosphotransferase